MNKLLHHNVDNMIKKIILFDNNGKTDYELINKLLLLIPDIEKLRYISSIDGDGQKKLIVLGLRSDSLKIKCINDKMFKEIFYERIIIDSINDKQLLKNYYETCPSYLKEDIIKQVKEDTFTDIHFNELNYNNKIWALRNFKSQELLKKYVFLFVDSEYFSELINLIHDDQFIIDHFNNYDSLEEKVELIKCINNFDLKLRLINELGPCMCKDIFLSDYTFNKENFMSNVDLKDIIFDVDSSITIGVELEASSKQYYEIIKTGYALGNWKIKNEGSINSGLEITSPILRFNEQSLKELYYICYIMNKNNVDINNQCGGHIHLGFGYFNTKEEFNRFLNLYASVEDIIYIISNKSGNVCRDNINTHAKYLTKDFNNTIKRVNLDSIASLHDYAELVKENQNTRCYGLNVQNIGTDKNTIEFRVPNGELDFYEIVNNIRLFTKLLQSIKLIETDQYKLELFYGITEEDLNDTDRFYMLLDLLFDNEEEKNIYKKRYNNNVKLLSKRA